MPVNRLTRLVLVLAVGVGAAAGCGDPPGEAARDDGAAAADTPAAERAASRAETLSIEGMPEPLSLRLFEAPDDFPVPFAAYVPDDMDPRADPSERTAHFTAEFGGARNDDAFVHLYVFQEGTPLREAVGAARGYSAGRSGIPVSRGMDPLTDDGPPPELSWAIESFRFRYQHGDQWYLGSVGVGRENQRHFMIVRHYPAEFADGFAPRADLILETWRWADGSPLRHQDATER